jgi:hypothetical protein
LSVGWYSVLIEWIAETHTILILSDRLVSLVHPAHLALAAMHIIGPSPRLSVLRNHHHAQAEFKSSEFRISMRHFIRRTILIYRLAPIEVYKPI